MISQKDKAIAAQNFFDSIVSDMGNLSVTDTFVEGANWAEEKLKDKLQLACDLLQCWIDFNPTEANFIVGTGLIDSTFEFINKNC